MSIHQSTAIYQFSIPIYFLNRLFPKKEALNTDLSFKFQRVSNEYSNNSGQPLITICKGSCKEGIVEKEMAVLLSLCLSCSRSVSRTTLGSTFTFARYLSHPFPASGRSPMLKGGGARKWRYYFYAASLAQEQYYTMVYSFLLVKAQWNG